MNTPRLAEIQCVRHYDTSLTHEIDVSATLAIDFQFALPTALPNHVSFGATAKKQYYWQAPAQCAATVGPTPLIAPILTLASSELLEVTRYLSLHDLTFLYLSGCRALWSRIVGVTREASSTHLFDTERDYILDFRIIPFNPFPLLSTMRMLRTVKLHRLEWYPDPREASPLTALPPGLDRLEFSFVWNKDNHSLHLFRDFDYKTAFPSLRTLRINFYNPSTFNRSEPSLKLPSTLTSLELSGSHPPESVLRCLNNDPTLCYDRKSNPSITTSSQRPTTPSTFPSLHVLTINHFGCGQLPPLPYLPRHLVHFGWSVNPREIWFRSAYYDYDSNDVRGDEEATQIVASSPSDAIGPVHCLKSVYLRLTSEFKASALAWLEECTGVTSIEHLENASFRTVPPLASKLKTLNFIAYKSSSFNERLIESCAQLTSLRVDALVSCNNETQQAQFIGCLQSLTSLKVSACDSSIMAGLPSTLTSLTLLSETRDIEPIVHALPRSLIRLSLRAPFELSLMRQLPRSILHLSLYLRNEKKVGASLVRQGDGSLLNGELDYRLVPSGANVIYELPPNLLSLNLNGYDKVMEFESTEFGTFLPRSLRLLTVSSEFIKIVIKMSLPTALGTIQSWFGISKQVPSEEEMIADVVRTFPSGCICNMGIYVQTMEGLQRLPWAMFKRVCSLEAAQ